VYQHKSYQLWESPIRGFLSTHNNDFILLNKDGMSYIKLGNMEARRSIENSDGIKRMIHSIGSANYLKIESSNMINISSWEKDEKDMII
jgi:hypothetical protein